MVTTWPSIWPKLSDSKPQAASSLNQLSAALFGRGSEPSQAKVPHCPKLRRLDLSLSEERLRLLHLRTCLEKRVSHCGSWPIRNWKTLAREASALGFRLHCDPSQSQHKLRCRCPDGSNRDCAKENGEDKLFRALKPNKGRKGPQSRMRPSPKSWWISSQRRSHLKPCKTIFLSSLEWNTPLSMTGISAKKACSSLSLIDAPQRACRQGGPSQHTCPSTLHRNGFERSHLKGLNKTSSHSSSPHGMLEIKPSIGDFCTSKPTDIHWRCDMAIAKRETEISVRWMTAMTTSCSTP